MSGKKSVRLGRLATDADPLRIAVLISGRGSNMEAIIRATQAGSIPAKVALVASDRPDAAGLAKAVSYGLRTWTYPNAREDLEGFYRELADELEAADVEIVALAGFMRILPEWVVDKYKHRILNIHPSLLPSFPGLHPHRQALEHGVKVSGCTVHLVDAGVDSGPILLQRAVQVRDDDTEERLATRILAVEHEIYPEALRRMAKGTLVLSGRRVYQDSQGTE